MLAVICVVGIYSRCMRPVVQESWTKWYFTAICFVLLCNYGVSVILMVPWLVVRSNSIAGLSTLEFLLVISREI